MFYSKVAFMTIHNDNNIRHLKADIIFGMNLMTKLCDMQPMDNKVMRKLYFILHMGEKTQAK